MHRAFEKVKTARVLCAQSELFAARIPHEHSAEILALFVRASIEMIPAAGVTRALPGRGMR